MDFNQFLQEQMQDDNFLRQYYRDATFHRLSDQFILLRKKRGLTQKDLAEKANTTQAVVSRLENVSVRPSLDNVVKLAEALDAIVEVRLVPLEEVRKKTAGKNASENSKFEMLGDLVARAKTEQKPASQINLENPNSSQWSISDTPGYSSPVIKKQQQPEFA